MNLNFINDKRVLFCFKEEMSTPVLSLLKDFSKVANEVGIFFVNPAESVIKESAYNRDTYYWVKDNFPTIRIYNASSLFNTCLEDSDKDWKPKVDWDLGSIYSTSQYLSRAFHHRFFFKRTTESENIRVICAADELVKKVLDDFKPDYILDTDDSELVRCRLVEMAKNYRVPYITIDYPRIGYWKLFTHSLGKRIDDSFSSMYELNYREKNISSETIAYYQDFKEGTSIMSKEFANTLTSSYHREKLIKIVKSWFGKLHYLISVYSVKGNRRFLFRSYLFIANPWLLFAYFVKSDLLRWRLLGSRNSIFSVPDIECDYVYMPLHLIPESTTFVKAPLYVNELSVIEAISRSMPVGCLLFVKEHQAMLGERSLKFYKRIKELPNVKLISVNYYTDPKPLIANSKLVITISGTSAYEAALLGIPSVVFSDVPFSLINGVHRIRSFERLNEIIYSALNGLLEIDEDSVLAYIQTVFDLGETLDLKYLVATSVNFSKTGEIKDQRFLDSLTSLVKIWEKGIEHYNA